MRPRDGIECPAVSKIPFDLNSALNSMLSRPRAPLSSNMGGVGALHPPLLFVHQSILHSSTLMCEAWLCECLRKLSQP